MINKENRAAINLDIVGLLLAGLINTFLALFVAGIILGPGTRTGQTDLLFRTNWITENTLWWQAGWLFWFAVTLSFAWSYFALGRHLKNTPPWPTLAIGLALIAAAVDLVGVLINMTILPELAAAIVSASAEQNSMLAVSFHSMESLSNGLTNITAFGLYSVAGLLLLPAAFATVSYPRWLAWLGTVEWGIAMFATILLVVAPAWATGPLLVSFALYAPWVWGSALWLHRHKPAA